MPVPSRPDRERDVHDSDRNREREICLEREIVIERFKQRENVHCGLDAECLSEMFLNLVCGGVEDSTGIVCLCWGGG